MKRSITPLLFALLFEVALLIVFGLITLITFGYANSNLDVWTNFGLLQYANQDGFALFLFFFSSAFQYVIFIYLALEAVLFLARTALKAIIGGMEKYTQKPQDKWRERSKKISTIGLYKRLGITNQKRAILSYVVVISVMFLSGFVGRTILKANDSLVYRTIETINLYKEERIENFRDQIDYQQKFNVIIEAPFANIHLYQVKQSVDAKFYFLYDDIAIKDQFDLTIDLENFLIVFTLNTDQTTYEKYVDPVLPSIEIYLPEWLQIDLVSIQLHHGGLIRVDYLPFQDLVIQASNAIVDVRNQTTQAPHLIDVTLVQSQLSIQLETIEEVRIQANQSKVMLRSKNITQQLHLSLTQQSEGRLYQNTIQDMQITSHDSTLQLIEVYAKTALMDCHNSTVYFSNGIASYPYDKIVILTENTKLDVRGIPYDTTRE